MASTEDHPDDADKIAKILALSESGANPARADIVVSRATCAEWRERCETAQQQTVAAEDGVARRTVQYHVAGNCSHEHGEGDE